MKLSNYNNGAFDVNKWEKDEEDDQDEYIEEVIERQHDNMM